MHSESKEHEISNLSFIYFVLNKKFNIPFFRLFYIGLLPDKSLDIRSKKEILFIYPLIEILILCSLFLAYIRFDSLEQFIALSFFVSLFVALVVVRVVCMESSFFRRHL